MIIHGNSVPAGTEVDADICVIGAGPAGLSVALRFAKSPHRVYVLETGSEHPDEMSLRMSAGESTGYQYFSLDRARARVLGGSSYIWEEWMRARPLDPVDFKIREGIPHSGWPLSTGDLSDHYRQAHALLGLGPWDYEVPAGHVLDAWPGDAGMQPVMFRYSNEADFTTRRHEIESSANLCLVLGSTATALLPSDIGASVDRVVVAGGEGGDFTVKARVVVLAGGGIENPRLMLLSDALMGNLGSGPREITGRFFMEHPRVRTGYVELAGEMVLPVGVFDRAQRPDGAARVALAPTEDLMASQRMANGMILLSESTRVRETEAYRSIAIVRDRMIGRPSSESWIRHLANAGRRPGETLSALRSMSGRGSSSERVLRISATTEQLPDPESRVDLGTSTDPLGQRIPRLHWRVSPEEARTIRVMQETLDEVFRELGWGRVVGFLGEEYPRRVFRGEWHQMGTTRMSEDPASGVVDRNCRVHGVDNLYVAGASVFPTVGYANPTLTVVALALRLAAHLDGLLDPDLSLGPIW